MVGKEQTTARAKCGGLSTAAANAPPSVEMTILFGGGNRQEPASVEMTILFGGGVFPSGFLVSPVGFVRG